MLIQAGKKLDATGKSLGSETMDRSNAIHDVMKALLSLAWAMPTCSGNGKRRIFWTGHHHRFMKGRNAYNNYSEDAIIRSALFDEQIFFFWPRDATSSLVPPLVAHTRRHKLGNSRSGCELDQCFTFVLAEIMAMWILWDQGSVEPSSDPCVRNTHHFGKCWWQHYHVQWDKTTKGRDNDSIGHPLLSKGFLKIPGTDWNAKLFSSHDTSQKNHACSSVC